MLGFFLVWWKANHILAPFTPLTLTVWSAELSVRTHTHTQYLCASVNPCWTRCCCNRTLIFTDNRIYSSSNHSEFHYAIIKQSFRFFPRRAHAQVSAVPTHTHTHSVTFLFLSHALHSRCLSTLELNCIQMPIILKQPFSAPRRAFRTKWLAELVFFKSSRIWLS